MGYLEKTVFSYVLLFATILEGLGDVLKGLGVALGGFGAVLGDGSVKILMSWSVSGRSWGLDFCLELPLVNLLDEFHMNWIRFWGGLARQKL